MPPFVIDRRPPGSHYLFATVRVHINYDGGSGSGTAFFFRTGAPSGPQRYYLVTNKHVLEDAKSVRLKFHRGPSSEPWQFSVTGSRTVEIAADSPLWFHHPDPEVDLCALRLSDLKAAHGDLSDIYLTSISESEILDPESEGRLPSLMNIAMIGYPQGIWDEANNLPIQRRGTTASHPAVSFNGRPEVVIDMACFPGSSGSPVVYHDLQYFASVPRFLGVLYAGPTATADGRVLAINLPTRLSNNVSVETMMHLGYVIKAQVVRELAALMDPSDV